MYLHVKSDTIPAHLRERSLLQATKLTNINAIMFSEKATSIKALTASSQPENIKTIRCKVGADLSDVKLEQISKFVSESSKLVFLYRVFKKMGKFFCSGEHLYISTVIFWYSGDLHKYFLISSVLVDWQRSSAGLFCEYDFSGNWISLQSFSDNQVK